MSPSPEQLQSDVRPVGIRLSPGCFTPTDLERRTFTELVRHQVQSLLREEARYTERRARQQPFLHAGEWKQVKREQGLTFYRRHPRGRSLRELALQEDLPEIQRAVERGYTSMICDGHIAGTIEDMMYGMTASSQLDLMTGFSYKNPPKDCVWLGTVETATPDDPFHTADLIWALPKLPPFLVDQVDVCYLKATGVQFDENDERYGYLVLHGVHIAQCPAFAAHGIARAKMYFACLFREHEPGILKVTVRGIFDLTRKVKMLTGLVSAATTSIMIGLLNGVGIGEAKKLTLLARRSSYGLRSLADSPRENVCYMCTKRASFFGRVRMGVYLVVCQVCGGTVCSDCTRGIKQRIFLGSKPCSLVDCCPNCIREAVTKTRVRPAEPEFQVVAEYYLRKRPRPSSAPKEAATSPTHSEEMKTNSSSADLPTNSTADESVGEYRLEFDDDPFSLGLYLPELRRSSNDDDNDSRYDNESEPIHDAVDGSSTTQVSVWRGNHHLCMETDFVPASNTTTRGYTNGTLAESIEQQLRELNMQAERTYVRTLESMRSLHNE
ncbi:hypothetical protein PRIC2_007865 [Phytophthora ramorum]